MKKTQTFEEFLKDHFIGMDEYGGIPIIKDNFEDLFDKYLEENIQEVIDLAEVWKDEEFNKLTVK